jgi:DNA-binding response OmpR family regulator
LLVEDDPMVASGVQMCLGQDDFSVVWVQSAEQALHAVRDAGDACADAFDVAVFDLGLPGLDGIGLIRTLRSQRVPWPFLILTARDAVQDRVQGLDAGADDYMVKPFEAPELLARLRALLRRSQAACTAKLAFGPLVMDTAHRRVTGQLPGCEEQELDIGPREWVVLEQLLRTMPKAVSKETLLQAMSSLNPDLTPNAVEVYISRLRAKVERAGVSIAHVRGYGYRLQEMC